MAINKKLIHFKKYTDFIGSSGTNGVTSPSEGYYNNIPENSIVFILDTLQIWTHGRFYDGSTFDPSDLESNKQDKLVSGTNIKTINGESILGEGNLTVTTEEYVNNAIASAITTTLNTEV